jgi:hypothetical protein
MSKVTQLLMRIDSNRKRKLELDREEVSLYEQLQKVCEHPSIERGGGEEWQSWPDYGRHPFFLRCRICKLYGKYPSEGGSTERTNWDTLDRIKKFQDSGAVPV